MSGDSKVSGNTSEDVDSAVPGWGEASSCIWQMVCVQQQQDYCRKTLGQVEELSLGLLKLNK